jgi:hypothetical protein
MEVDLLATVTKFVEEGDITRLQSCIFDADNRDQLNGNSSELISLISSGLFDKEQTDSNSASNVVRCDSILLRLAECGSAKANVLALLESCGLHQPVARFRATVGALGLALSRIAAASNRRAVWAEAVEAVVRYLHVAVPAPSSFGLEGEERITLDADHSDVVSLVHEVDVYFLEVLMNSLQKDSSDFNEISRVLAVSCLQILSQPVVHCSLHIEGERKFRPRALEVALSLANKVAKLVPNAVEFFDWPDATKAQNATEESEDEELPERRITDQVPIKGIGVLFYLFYGENDPGAFAMDMDLVPSCYHPLHLMQQLLRPATALLDTQEDGGVHKGLLLAQGVLSRVEPASLLDSLLDSKVCSDFLVALVGVVTYCEVGEFRRLAFAVLQQLHKAVFCAARQRFYRVVFERAGHSGLRAWVITSLKDDVLLSLTQRTAFEQLGGHRLRQFVVEFCRLKNGAETDVLEVSEEIMAALNFLWCLLARDKSNETGLRDLVPALRKEFLDPLREALRLGKAHYQAQMRCSRDEPSESELVVGGQLLPPMSASQRDNVIRAALTTFDLIECTLSRFQAFDA